MADSWYVEILLRNRDQIRSNILSRMETKFEVVEEVDLEDDDYNNLLLVEKTITELNNNNQLSDRERKILALILDHKSLSKIRSITGLSRATISKVLEKVCDRISYVLGGIFTNEGYLEYMAQKHNLTDEQIDVAREFMNSNRRYFYVHKSINNAGEQNER